MANADVNSFAPTVKSADMSVSATESSSSEFYSGGFQPISVELPTLDGTTTHILFKAGNTSGSLDWLRYEGVIMTIDATSTRDIVDPIKFGGGYEYWQLFTCSDALGTLDAQAADRAITVNFAKIV